MKLIIVTGLSGSGKSIALNTLEDLGYYCIDNLPVFLLHAFIDALASRHDPRFDLTAVGIDARNLSSAPDSIKPLQAPLQAQGIECEVLYLEAQDETLLRRYSETRRRHPLADDEHPLAEAIQLERKILDPFLTSADLTVDTTHTNLHQLRDIIRSRLGEHSSREISLLFESFGFKHGVPRNADFVYDARCLPNPHWQKELRPLTGKDADVAYFLEQDDRVTQFKQAITEFLEHWIPCFEADGRSYLTVAIGCTGGQHRSVYLVEQLSGHFRRRGQQILTRHRELS